MLEKLSLDLSKGCIVGESFNVNDASEPFGNDVQGVALTIELAQAIGNMENIFADFVEEANVNGFNVQDEICRDLCFELTQPDSTVSFDDDDLTLYVSATLSGKSLNEAVSVLLEKVNAQMVETIALQLSEDSASSGVYSYISDNFIALDRNDVVSSHALSQRDGGGRIDVSPGDIVEYNIAVSREFQSSVESVLAGEPHGARSYDSVLDRAISNVVDKDNGVHMHRAHDESIELVVGNVDGVISSANGLVQSVVKKLNVEIIRHLKSLGADVAQLSVVNEI
ncbi:hypothetical protein AB4254_09335 [Vibrio breoganii]